MKQQPPLPPSFQAFTVKANGGRLNKIVTAVAVSKPSLNGEPPGAKDIRQTTAIWDTGATQSVVTKATARSLDLVPSGMARMFHAGGESDVNAYLVNLHLPNGLNVAAVHVLEMEDGQDFGVLIGMDVITLGDFTITNVGGITTVSFRYPSIQEIDFVVESNRINAMAKGNQNAVGRNDLCPCGSQRKYKNCHGKI